MSFYTFSHRSLGINININIQIFSSILHIPVKKRGLTGISNIIML